MKIQEALEKNHPLLTDGGLETTFIYDYGFKLPHFAAFIALQRTPYRKMLKKYYRSYLDLAVKYKTGFILESPTWRANTDWGSKLRYTEEELFHINKSSIYFLDSIRSEYRDDIDPLLVSGCVGPRSDGYVVGERMSVEEAMSYHYSQLKAFREGGADMSNAMTMNYVEEALGIVLSAKDLDLPVVVSFTVETDGCLPDGNTLEDAIMDLDWSTGSYPLYYMVNCAHPRHYLSQLHGDSKFLKRIRACRSNASCLSHAELDNAEELVRDPLNEYSDSHVLLKSFLPSLHIYGGCCGTDHRNLEGICDSLLYQHVVEEKKKESIFI